MVQSPGRKQELVVQLTYCRDVPVNDPLTRVTVGTNFNGAYVASDVSRRFGTDDQFGVRVDTAYHDGGTDIDQRKENTWIGS